MDAGIRCDLVECSPLEETIISESFADRAVSMLTKNKRNIETGDPPEEAQVFNYNPRAGENGQFKLFRYQYPSRGVLSETPRTGQNAESQGDLTIEFQGLALVDSDEEYESENYTLSPMISTGCRSTEQANLPAPSIEADRYRAVKPDYNPEICGSRARVLLNSRPADDTIATHPTSTVSGCTTSQLKNIGQHIYPSRASIDDRTTFQRLKDEVLDTGQYVTGNGAPPQTPTSISSLGYHQKYSMRMQESHLPLDGGSDVQSVITERPLDGRKSSLLDLAGSSGYGHMENPEENCLEFSQSLDPSQAEIKYTPLHQMPFGLATADISAGNAANHTLQPPKLEHEEKDLPRQIADETRSSYGDGKAGESDEKEIIAVLRGLNFQSMTTIQVSTSDIEPASTKTTPKSERTPSPDFDPMAHAFLGIGSWIKEDAHDILVNVDVEGLCDFYSTGNDLGTLEDQFDPGWQVTFRTCPGDSTSGSTPQKNSCGNSSEYGSHGTRQSPPNDGGRHRKHASDGGDGAGEEDDPVQPKRPKMVNGTQKRLICPFYIHDPAYFQTSEENGQKYTICAAGQGFADISRLKEHLKRVHSPEIACPRCGLAFMKQHLLDMHLNLRNENGPSCQVLELPPSRSMTPDMVAQLAERGKRQTNLSEEERWLKIYQILFPEGPRPSNGAYRHDFDLPLTPSQETQSFIHIRENDLPRLLEQRLDTRLGEMGSDLVSSERMKKMVISELNHCIKQLSAKTSETPNTLDRSPMLRHKPSEASSIDSGYGSKCGTADSMGNYSVCEPLVSPVSQQPQVNSPFDSPEQYLNPSMFIGLESTGNLQSTDSMYELLDLHFPLQYSDNPFLDSSGT